MPPGHKSALLFVFVAAAVQILGSPFDFAALSVVAEGALMGVESEIAEQVGLADDYIVQRFDFLLRVLLDVGVDSVMKHPKMPFSAQLKCRIGYMFNSGRI